VMSEMGVAMMGSARASGIDRANVAAQQAVASPLLEDVNLTGARGVLVNITASKDMRLKEVHEVMNTISAFTAPDATVIFGSVVDESMGDALRVTIVATGLGQPVMRSTQAKPPFSVVRTGTDNIAVEMGESSDALPAVMRRGREQRVSAMRDSGIDHLDIPAFLRKQAD